MRLIIEADDFGLSKSITDGIVDGINGGYITSTNIMANMPFAKYAVEKAIENNIKSVGLHLNLTVGEPLTKNPLLTDENGIFLQFSLPYFWLLVYNQRLQFYTFIILLFFVLLLVLQDVFDGFFLWQNQSNKLRHTFHTLQ